MIRKKAVSYGMLVFGGLASILGMALVITYIREAVVARAGDPDQSLLFWCLPILFMGIISMLAGFGVGAWGFSIARRMSRSVLPAGEHRDADGGSQNTPI